MEIRKAGVNWWSDEGVSHEAIVKAKFKLYEYDSDTEYELTPSSMVNFANESCVGNPGSPLVLSVIDVNAVVVTAKNYTRKYGETNPAFEFTSLGITLEGIPNISCNAIATSPVGTYTIKVGKGTVTNESVTFVDGTLTITKAPLTITAKSYTIKQGEALPAFAATYSGFKNNETQSVLTKKPTFSCAATSASAPGTYDITVSGAEAGNYDISYVKGTLTIEKKTGPEPVTRSPFNGEINLPGTLEAENFDKGGEGITYHDNDAEDHGGTNYRSGDDLGMDVVTGNGGYAIGWTNGGEWAEYTVNVTEAGMYTLEAMVSNGTGNKGGFSISLVGDGGRLTKLADVGISPTENWDSYQSVKGDLLQSLKTGTQVFRITITDGNCNIDKVKFEKKDEPEPDYKVGDDITSLATADWEGKTGDYGGLANASVERYTHGTPKDVGDILTQTVSGLRNGTYRVLLEVAASFTPERGFECPTGDGLSVVFANNTQRNLPVLERDWVSEGEQKLVTLTATVTDGTLKYGIKNLALSGNWFVARLKSIVYVASNVQSPKTYTISIASEKNGKTTTDVTADEKDSRVFITTTPDEGCTLESLKVTTTGGKAVELTGNSFIMPASAVTVTATYKAPEQPKLAGDANGDGIVNVFDVTAMVNYILGSPNDGFVFAAADVNGDGIVNVFDVTKVVNIILGVDDGSAKTRKAEGQSGTDKLYIEDFEIEPGEEKEVNILLNNPDAEYRDLQFDLYLPEGITVVQDEDEEFMVDKGDRCTKKHTIGFSYTDGHYVCMLYSTAKNPLTGNSGDILSITLKADENVATGAQKGYFRNVSLSKTDATGPTYDELSFDITVKGDVDGISDVVVNDGPYQIYTIDGEQVENLHQGVNIIRYSDGTTKKVYVK